MRQLTSSQPREYPLASKRSGRKSKNVTGSVHLQFTLYDPFSPSATPQQVLAKLSAICGADSPLLDGENGQSQVLEGQGLDGQGLDSQGLERIESGDLEDEEGDEAEVASEADESKTPETAEKKRRKRRIAILKRTAKLRGYEFSSGSDVAGVLFLEVQRIVDLPPERNGMFTFAV